MAQGGKRKRGREEPVHDCLLYRTREEKIDAVRQTVQEALRRGERCLLILPRDDAPELMRRLRQHGVDGDALVRRGVLLIRSPENPPGICDDSRLAEYVEAELGEDDASPSLFIMDAALCAPGTEHEGGLDRLAHSRAVRIICLYHLTSRLSAGRIVHLIQGHRRTQLLGAVRGEMPGKGHVRYVDEAYSLLLEVEDEAVFVTDRQGRLLLLNEAAGALLGRSVEEMRGRALADFVHLEDWERLDRARHQALKTGEPVTLRLEPEYGGKKRSWLVTTGGYRDGDGTGYTFAIVRDLTERNDTEQKLRFTAQLMNVIDQAVIATDGRGVIIFWNRAAEALYGWKALEVLGHDVLDVVTGKRSPEQEGGIRNAPGQGLSWSGESVLKRRDGTEFLAHVTDTPIRDNAGRLLGVIGISFDITGRRQAEEALATSEERFRRYFELGLVGLSITSPDRRIIEVNDKICEMLAYPREELLRMSWPELTHPDDLAASDEAFRRILGGEAESYTMEKRYLRKDGDAIDAVVSVSCLRRKDGSIDSFVSLVQDITDWKRAEREIAAYQQQLSLLTAEMYRMEDEERQHLAAVLHDQIGQNLALSKMKLESLKTIGGRDELAQEIGQISALLDDVIQKTRSLTTELRPPVLHELGLRAAVESLCEEFQEQTGIIIRYRDDGATVAVREPLSTLLFRGVRELLVNVMKHADATRAEVTIAGTDDRIRVTVADNGVGFDPRKRRFKGSFGLFSLTERLRHVGGAVEVTSAPGKGTRIDLTAPFQSPPTDSASTENGTTR